ncbi:MAG: hypothetical protein UU67_C0007G0018 [Candidatus Daviesbacteria bacterium GW2011_GWB1_41_5]|uniref:DUF5615 domain-containing protein n=2 Tax=Candidatus Daviesiibacteriota TaxID=1752718 RepID=A0A0G0WPY7_9BACT|nr:MAG: hypothetical protein UU67_C0007G0018 [Candidatus Daviesbacteria bacterium GW2011_GWB1_41_5]
MIKLKPWLMKFLADINIPQSVITYLIQNNHAVLDFKKIDLLAKDTEIIKVAQKEGRIVLTLDKDFIGLTQFPKYHVACIVIRLRNQNPKNIVNYLNQLLNNQKAKILEKSLTIIKSDIAESHSF